jgi:hypothetical protein
VHGQSTMHIPRSGLSWHRVLHCMRARHLTFPVLQIAPYIDSRKYACLLLIWSASLGSIRIALSPSHTWTHPFPFIFCHLLLATRRVRVTLPLMDHLSIFRLRVTVGRSSHLLATPGLGNDESQVAHSVTELFRIRHQFG